MTQFEFFMTFYSLLIGIAVAELLLGFSGLLRHRARPRLGLLTPLMGVLMFVQLLALFIDAWMSLKTIEIDMIALAVPTAIGVCVFAASTLVVPKDPSEWPDLDEYTYRNRRWTLGLLFAANLLIMVNESSRVPAQFLLPYALVNLVALSLMTAGMLLRPRLAVAISLGGLILVYLSTYGNSGLSLFGLFAWLTS
ncbi:hypothetical protein [Sphingomonas sp.]|jgi:hypothetical protein|uniref:hypothetical protein n=1 Tax=Sphingomonas sp. TaxID=28214 RepID=UPI002EDA8361